LIPAGPLFEGGPAGLSPSEAWFISTPSHQNTAPRRRTEIMRYRLGRVLQFLGLLILPFGIASELMGRVGLGQSLLIALGGIAVFYVGYLIQPHD
jgi:hypothetical protein